MSAFAAYATALPVSLLSACDSLETSLATSPEPAQVVEGLYDKALDGEKNGDRAVKLLRYYLTGAALHLLNADGTVTSEKLASNELKMYCPLPQLVLTNLLAKATAFKLGENANVAEKGVAGNRLESVKWSLGVMSSSDDGPVGTVLLSMTSSTLDDKKETVDLELSVDEFMKLKNKLMDASREMRLA